MRDERAPLPGSTRLALVKPQDALLTPAVFKALQLGGRSTEEPEGLLAALRLAGGGPGGGDRGALQALAVNDLEAPAFALLPSLGLLKARLMADGSTGGYEAVFMSGSGSTLVCLGGGGAAPAWAAGEGLFVANGVRMITRQPGRWYDAPPPPASGA